MRLQRYLWIRVGTGIALGTAMLLAIYTSIELVRQAAGLQGEYGVGAMLLYLIRTTPTRLVDVFPFACLIGSLMGLGALAANRELEAMRAAGFGRERIALAAMLVVLVLAVAMVAIGELIVPSQEAQARVERQQARSGRISMSRDWDLWLRDGERMIRIDTLTWDPRAGVGFAGITAYTLDSEMRVGSIVQARQGQHQEGRWRFEAEYRIDLDADAIASSPAPGWIELESTIEPDVFGALVTRPRLMSIADLGAMITYLEANGLDPAPYRLAFWRRLFYPFGVLAMVFAGMPLVFRPGREHGRGINVFFGISVGMGFVIVDRLGQALTPVWPLPLWFSALLPALIFAVAGYWWLRRL